MIENNQGPIQNWMYVFDNKKICYTDATQKMWLQNYKNWTLPKNFFFLLKQLRRQKTFRDVQFPKEITFFFQIKNLLLLQDQILQPVLSIEIFISDLTV